ncbi:hypothetical protein ABT024_11730 [Streptomyces sp. NPDC002812]|uniref:hypothetical protein n=1 Tax=Streptomyces sp. NPDC002812 TaxID=3154434 RepID=UPI003320EA01
MHHPSARVATLTRFVEGAPGDCEPSCGPGSVRFQADVPKLAVLGDYTVDVEYTGTRGEPVHHQDKATLNYRLRPVFSGLKSANAVSLDRRDTTISGDIKLYDPRDGSRKPYAGAAFTAASGGVTTALVADAQGHFVSKVTVHGTDGDPVRDPRGGKLPGWETAVSLSTEANGKKEQARAAVPVTPVEARIALDSTTVTGPYATRGKVGGSFTWKAADGTWKPVPGAMELSVGGDPVATDTAWTTSSSPRNDEERRTPASRTAGRSWRPASCGPGGPRRQPKDLMPRQSTASTVLTAAFVLVADG